MKFVEIGEKLVNIENIRYIIRRVDKNTGKVYCLYVFDRETFLEEIFDNSDAFKDALRRMKIIKKRNISKRILYGFLLISALLKRFFQEIRKNQK